MPRQIEVIEPDLNSTEYRLDALSAQVTALRTELKAYTHAAINKNTRLIADVLGPAMKKKFSEAERARNLAIDKRLGSVRSDVDEMRSISAREINVAAETINAAGFSYQFSGDD